MKKTRIAIIIIAFLCMSFIACDNPIMKKWWVEDEPDLAYVTILKNIPIPEVIYDTVVDTVIVWKEIPPSEVLQSIEIIGIDYIIFAGNSETFNGPPVPASGTPLTTDEKNYNTSTIAGVATMLKDNSDYLVMLHGHANPVDYTLGETVELMELSLARAEDVATILNEKFVSLTGAPPMTESRMNISGYGGEKTLFGNNSPYTALNRRVEIILFRIITN